MRPGSGSRKVPAVGRLAWSQLRFRTAARWRYWPAPASFAAGTQTTAARRVIDGDDVRAQAPLPVRGRDAVLPNLSNSPSRAPPRKASHSPCVNLRTGPSGSRLLRTPTEPPGSSVTSRQLPLEKLRELFVQ